MQRAKLAVMLTGVFAMCGIAHHASGDGPRGSENQSLEASRQTAREQVKAAQKAADARAKTDAEVQEVLRRGALDDAALQAKIAKQEAESRAKIEEQRSKAEAELGLAPGALQKIADLMDPEVSADQYKSLEAQLALHPEVSERLGSVFADNVVTGSEFRFVEILINRIEKPQVIQRTKARILELKQGIK